MTGRVPIVLLVEPDPIQRGTLARLLKTAGYCVISAGRVHEALETFSTHHVDIALVVADTDTTTRGGPPLLESLARIDPFVPVVALTTGVAIERPAYEYSNVAATLLRPFEPADVLGSVERLLLAASAPAAAPTPAAAAAPVSSVARAMTLEEAFNWPPTEQELDDIQVVETTDWRAAAEPPALATIEPPAEPGLAVVSAPPSTDVAPVAPVEMPSPARLVPPRLIIRGLERRQWSYGDRLPASTRRSLTIAATVLCGLALTTLLEWRSVPTRRAGLTDETVREVPSPPLLASNDHRIDTMPLASARRVTPRPMADTIARVSQPPAPITAASRAPRADANGTIASRRAEDRDVPTRNVPSSPSETRAIAAVVPPTVAAPAPARVAPAEATTTAAAAPARDDAASANDEPAANVPAPIVASAGTPHAAAVGTPAVASAGTPTARFAVTRSGADEQDIYQVLQRYERAYERLDVNAARAVWPSLDTRALARAFGGLKEQALEFSHCRVALDLAEATAICGGRASYVPRVGRQAARTEPREWTFRLRKVDHDWLIAKAEVR